MSDHKRLAVVTGASSGIGRAIAVELADRGYSLFVTGRDIKALNELSDELKNYPNISVEVYAADLLRMDDRKHLTEILLARDVEILVNNAGSGVKGDFINSNASDEIDLINVQLTALIELTKAALPSMKNRGSGLILNVSSVYAFAPVPQQAVYSASKSFIYSFSASLNDELKNTGVTVSVLAPGVTRTAFRTRAGITDKPNAGMSANEVAKVAVESLHNRKFLIVPGLPNKLFVFISKHLPTSMTIGLINLINSKRGVRDR